MVVQRIEWCLVGVYLGKRINGGYWAVGYISSVACRGGSFDRPHYCDGYSIALGKIPTLSSRTDSVMLLELSQMTVHATVDERMDSLLSEGR